MNSRSLLQVDWGLLFPTFVLIALSLTTLFSLNVDLFKSQFFFFLLSLCAFFFFAQFNVSVLKHYPIQIYAASVLLLLLILFIGFESRGSVRWLDIFGVRLQFSEILKPFLGITLASFLATRKPSSKTLFLTSLLMFPIIFLVFKQPDLGNTLIFFFSTILILFVYGISIVWFGIGIVAVVGFIPFFWHMLHEYQRQRILTFVHPSSDPLGTSYNAMQSIIAVGSGKFLGRGIGEGTQSMLRFLPERHTDFIFASLSEGFGFVAGIIVILAFVFLFYRIFIIISYTQDRFSKLFGITAFIFLVVQLFINIGMNIGILPITGVTLPFISYGGSSLLANYIFLGLLSAMGRNMQKRDILEIR